VAQLRAGETLSEVPPSNQSEAWDAVQGFLYDDLNTPRAIAALSEPLKSMNDLLFTKEGKKVCIQSKACFVSESLGRDLPIVCFQPLAGHTDPHAQAKDRLQTLQAHHALINTTLELLGVDIADPSATMADMRQLALQCAHLTEEQVQGAMEARAAARKARDFEKADAVRKEFAALGIAFKDSPAGTTWYPAPVTPQS
jgi:cysteinyl-tRNA synthetase